MLTPVHEIRQNVTPLPVLLQTLRHPRAKTMERGQSLGLLSIDGGIFLGNVQEGTARRQVVRDVRFQFPAVAAFDLPVRSDVQLGPEQNVLIGVNRRNCPCLPPRISFLPVEIDVVLPRQEEVRPSAVGIFPLFRFAVDDEVVADVDLGGAAEGGGGE